MAQTNINTLKSWFVRGARPLASQFADWMDSFWHKDESLPLTAIEGLKTALDRKIDEDQMENLIGRVQYERRIAFAMERTEMEMFFAEPVTLYRIAGINVEKFYVTVDGITHETELSTPGISIEIPENSLVTFSIERQTIDTRSHIFIYAKVKLADLRF